MLPAQGFPHALVGLFGARAASAEVFRDDCCVPLRLTSSTYHRFHAPCVRMAQPVTFESDDTWSVNPVTLALVPVAAIRVACIWLHWLDTLRQLRYRSPHDLPAAAHFAKGQEVGCFQHGSTILVLGLRDFFSG